MPQYGGTIVFAGSLPRSFDAHQDVGYGPMGQLPVFNQLVIYDLNYKETVPENIISDLAESWEWNQDGTEVTFKLHQGVTWHDGMPFTADDVVYSLDRMTDVTRSAISARILAYESSEKIDDYTVKVHLKYASAGFLIGLASGDAQIQAKHLAGLDGTSAAFAVGTGPFLLDEYLPGVHMKYKRNPDYFKRDHYGNQLPYLDGLLIKYSGGQADAMLIAKRTDMKTPVSSVINLDTWNTLHAGAPELVYQPKYPDWGGTIFINTSQKPLDDIRVRRALGLVLVPEDLIIGYSGDVKFGIPGQGLLAPSLGLPKEEVAKLMGWDKPMADRIAEAKQLMAEAGYPNGFKLNALSTSGSGTSGYTGVLTVFSNALKQNLNIDSTLNFVAGAEVQKRLDEDNYQVYITSLQVGTDPVNLVNYFGTGQSGNYSHYNNPDLDKMLAELDYVTDPGKRREFIWDIERTLLTDLPALPTGCFITNYMAAYPYVKNLRYQNTSYTRSCGFDEVWIDRDIYLQMHGRLPSAELPPDETPTPTTTPAESTTPPPTTSQTADDPYNNPDWPVIWVNITPETAIYGEGTQITVTLKVPPGSMCDLTFINPVTGTRSARKPTNVVADADGNAVLGPWEVSVKAAVGEATLELTNTKTDGTKIVVTHPYTIKEK
jgi:peptide/nickel transport system substrate-binding protein